MKQLELDLIFSDLKPGEKIEIPVSDDDIGGELLNILSRGLYTNPLDAIREYAQNAIDANAKTVTIQITGNSVFILDDGDGMTAPKLLQSREFGVSEKSLFENVGFRGIGIYSGFDLCEVMTIVTKAKNEDIEHTLEFNFGRMKLTLDQARSHPDRPRVSLPKLLEQNITYSYEESTRSEESFTLVQLESLSDNHINRLSNVEEMQKYILQNLPISFSDEFRYGEEIENALLENVKGYKSAKVRLAIEGAPEVIVEKPNIPDLDPPKKGFVYSSKGKPIAYYWACLVSGSEGLTKSRKLEEHAGIVYKVKGFSVGSRSKLGKYISRLYSWWTGEIYVLDETVIPTSARDDFEAGPARDSLEAAVKHLLSGADNEQSLMRTALKNQASRRADEVLNNAERKLSDIKTKTETGEFDPFAIYSELDDWLDKVKKQRGKVSLPANANKLIDEFKALQKYVKEEIDNPTPVADRKRKVVKDVMDDRAETTSDNSDENEVADNESTDNALDMSQATETESEEEAPATDEANESPSLLSVLELIGLELEEDVISIIELINETVVDFLDPEVFERDFLQSFEERLTEMLDE